MVTISMVILRCILQLYRRKTFRARIFPISKGIKRRDNILQICKLKSTFWAKEFEVGFFVCKIYGHRDVSVVK